MVEELKKGKNEGELRDIFSWRQKEHHFVKKFPSFALLFFWQEHHEK